MSIKYTDKAMPVKNLDRTASIKHSEKRASVRHHNSIKGEKKDMLNFVLQKNFNEKGDSAIMCDKGFPIACIQNHFLR